LVYILNNKELDCLHSELFIYLFFFLVGIQWLIVEFKFITSITVSTCQLNDEVHPTLRTLCIKTTKRLPTFLLIIFFAQFITIIIQYFSYFKFKFIYLLYFR